MKTLRNVVLSSYVVLSCSILASSITSELSGQINEGDLFATEFFEELFFIDVQNRTATDILIDDPGILDDVVVIGNDIFVSNSNEIWKVDVNTNTATLFTTVPSLTTMTKDRDNNLVITGSNGVQRVNTTNGQLSDVFDDSFFSPRGVAVSKNGDIFVTEFFEGLGRIDAHTNQFHIIGDFDANEFKNVVIGGDGNLYAAANTSDDIYRIDPYTGASSLFADFEGATDLAVDLDGNILVLGELTAGAPLEGIFQLDIDSGQIISLFDANDPDWGTFFSPSSIGVAQTGLFRAVPEPSTLGLMVIAGTATLFIRRRRS